MASTIHMAMPEDDRRHVPGPGSLPLWSESYWFPLYDPEREIGIVFRAGMYLNKGHANLYLFITHRGEVVHTFVDHRLPVPPLEDGRFTVGGLTVEFERPLERFRLRYAHGATGFDVVWAASSPVYKYPTPEGPEYPGHIEQGGVVTGTVTLGGARLDFDGFGHRDHSWGGERDWAKFHRWDYLSGEFGRDFWFQAARADLGPLVDVRIGCLWDGRELLALQAIDMDVHTTDGGTRQLGIETTLTDEHGRAHRIVGEEVLVNCPVQMGRTWLKDGFTRYRYCDRVGYGILEHGYVEGE